jgi:hypothetical protein
VAIIKNNVVTAETRKFPAILTHDRSCVSSISGTDDGGSHPSNHAFRIGLLLGKLSNIYGANANWNSSCKQMEMNTKVTERFLPDVGPGS